ncbi:FAD-dependent 5-carboxymethylaminomethyl-2-thiouridine(34) oxidoreductase MnmC [Caldimonas sp. KR1-144]|uniref:FAD-dependent 5-carboxymethylaminomethyl-2-thiouridine(34) oxidoreductase MnmC n=1 Tax=Caldimonas sp. KR1-144 TaxID=3400911 RepID=UPI003C0DE3BD
MKTAPIVPATLAFGDDGVPRAPAFGDVYHAAAGAAEQARHVFLGGNGLLGDAPRWAGREGFTILETGFGLGNNFLAAWDAWRRDPRRSRRLDFVSIEKHPPTREDLARVHAGGSPQARELVDAWPCATPNLHVLDFEAGRVRLVLALGDIELVLPQLLARVDAFFLDGFAPAKNPQMWQPRLFERLGRLAAPGATAATWSAARVVRDGLAGAGFAVEQAGGFAGKRDMTIARFAPRFVPPAPVGGLHVHEGERAAVIVGAGLAGCAAAAALARLDWHCTVLDALPAAGQATSGNPIGLMHATLHADDGPHARWLRAGALHMARSIAPALADGSVRGALDGFVRLEPRLSDEAAQALLARCGLPRGFVDWLDRAAARERTGVALPSGGWYFPQGGWLAPADVAKAWLAASGARFVDGVNAASIVRRDGRWLVLDAQARPIAEAPVLVIANALDAARLAGPALGPLVAVRGQISGWPVHPGLAAPRCAVSGAGYAAPALDGWLWTGATTQHGDGEASPRLADHEHNRARLAALLSVAPEAIGRVEDAVGRVGWRAVTPDRLPIVGALPDLDALPAATRADAPRLVARRRDAHGGLYVFTGLGSRGLSWAALGAELLASWIAGTPCPVEADLRDAADPARFALRAARAPTPQPR